MKGNVINLNTLHLNSVRLNGIGKVQSVSLKGGSTEDPVFPPVEPPIEPEPTPTYTLSASVTNGKVSAKRNGSAVNLPFTANEGDVIVVEVTPNDGYAFEGWADGNTDNPRSITMNADVALSAECVEVVQPPVGNYIQFEDAEVERVLMSKGVSSDGVGITMEDAAKVTSIGTWFKGNTTIQTFDELEYFTGLTFLGTGGNTTNGAFYNCTSLQSVKMPSSVTRLVLGAFNGCSSLKSVGNLSHIKQIEIAAFMGCAIEGEISLDSAEGTIGYSAFQGNKFITKVASLGNVTTLGGATPIGHAAFGHCENMQSIDLSKVQVLQTGALSYCYSLEEAIMPSVTDIQFYAFYSDSSLKKVDIGSNVTHIGAYAFHKCTSLATFICRATTPPTLDNINAFTSTNNCPIYVPDASLEAYRTATNWNQYADRIHPLSEIEGGHITTFEGLIGAYTFEGRSNEDADRDIVEDKSGYNNTLTLKSMQWGFIDSAHPDLVREGLWDDALWLSRSGYGEITLPNGLTDFTIIAKRFAFNANAGREWSPLVGTGKSSVKGLFWLEYNAGKGQYTNQVNGLNYTLPSLESEITWMTNTHYNGHRLTGTQGNDVHDGMVYINRFRGDVSTTKFQKIYAVYLFNRQLSPSEIEAFIKEKIDASYVLPTIEQ